jgi:hypothetical protein
MPAWKAACRTTPIQYKPGGPLPPTRTVKKGSVDEVGAEIVSGHAAESDSADLVLEFLTIMLANFLLEKKLPGAHVLIGYVRAGEDDPGLS